MENAKRAGSAIATMIPRGIDLAGSAVSSAASGTPSTARKNQIANGRAAQTPSRPNGRNVERPPARSGGMSVRLAGSKECGGHDEEEERDGAIAVITKISFSASPTP